MLLGMGERVLVRGGRLWDGEKESKRVAEKRQCLSTRHVSGNAKKRQNVTKTVTFL